MRLARRNKGHGRFTAPPFSLSPFQRARRRQIGQPFTAGSPSLGFLLSPFQRASRSRFSARASMAKAILASTLKRAHAHRSAAGITSPQGRAYSPSGQPDESGCLVLAL